MPYDLLTIEFINKLVSYNKCNVSNDEDLYDDEDNEHKTSRRAIILNEFNEKNLKWFLLFHKLIKKYTRYHDEYFTSLTVEHVFSHIIFICKKNVFTDQELFETKIKSKILKLSKLKNISPSFIGEEYFTPFEQIEICYDSKTSATLERYIFIIKPSP